MAWLGKVSLGNLGDIAGAVTKLSESVKNIEKNFDTALGFEHKYPTWEDFQGTSENTSVAETKEPLDGNSNGLSVSKDDDSSTAIVSVSTATPGESQNEHQADEAESVSNTHIMESLETGTPPTLPDVSKTEIQYLEGWEDLKHKTEIKRLNNEQPEKTDRLKEQDSCPEIDSTYVDVALPSGDHSSKGLHESTSEVEDSTQSSCRDDLEGFQEVVSSEMVEPPVNSAIPDRLAASDSVLKGADETEKLKSDVKQMESALQGAAKQAQMKADEISRLLLENDQLKAALEDLKRRSNDDALREEYQQRLGAAERKIYALTKERDMLRRDQARKSDSSALLKEKDEIIKQVMAEGEELSKKQAAQESQIRKLRAQVREIEEEKQRLNSKVQVEEAKVENMKREKIVLEKALQETIEKGHSELAAQKEFYVNALNEAKEAQARAEARADTEAKADLDRRLREASERESALLQTLDELRTGLSRTEQQAAFREDMLRKDLEVLEKRCQDAEARYDELVSHVPESTRPLLRQIEALQDTLNMRADAWMGVERSLNSRLQEAEAKAAAAQERERAINDRLSQTMSRMAVMEAQVSCLKAEQSQLTKSLEKERQRAAESRQDYLAAMEMAATQEGRVKQLEEEVEQLTDEHARDIAEEKSRIFLLGQELEQARASLAEYKNRAHLDGEQDVHKHIQTEHSANKNSRHLHSASMGNIEESYYLQASLDSWEHATIERTKNNDPPPPSPQRGKSHMTAASLEQLESLLRQKEGELASYTARLATLESTRDSLAEELVRTTTQYEKLRADTASLPSLRAELESLRRRHTSALELMGERDEQVEELRADLADVKEMYREQIDMLVRQIEALSAK